MQVTIGYPAAQDTRSRTAKRLGLRYRLAVEGGQATALPILASDLFRAVSHSTVTFEGNGTTWRSVQSWAGAPFKTAIFHDYGAPVLLLECSSNPRLTASFFRLDDAMIDSIIAALSSRGNIEIIRGDMTVRESLSERLRRRLSIHW